MNGTSMSRVGELILQRARHPASGCAYPIVSPVSALLALFRLSLGANCTLLRATSTAFAFFRLDAAGALVCSASASLASLLLLGFGATCTGLSPAS